MQNNQSHVELEDNSIVLHKCNLDIINILIVLVQEGITHIVACSASRVNPGSSS